MHSVKCDYDECKCELDQEESMSSLLEHAEREFEVAGWLSENDPMQNQMMANMRQLLKVFSAQGHSGFSANYAANLFNQLVRFETITPLTGADCEWVDVGDGIFQNKRAGHVFKEDDKAYDIEGKIFRDADGVCYTSRESRVPVTFPYTPKREYIDVCETEGGMMERQELKYGQVVQLDPETCGQFGGCFMLITEPKSFGAQGFVQIPGDGQAYFRANFAQMELIGNAEWAPLQTAEE